MTQRITYFLAAGLLLAGTLVTPASEPKLVQRTYPVADLIVPISDYSTSPVFNAGELISSGNQQQGRPTLEKQLIELIVKSVSPLSWKKTDGQTSIDYFPLGMALVVNQTLKVHAQIAALLESLRQNADKEVSIEFRVVTISEEMARRLRADGIFDCFCRACKKEVPEPPQVTIFTDLELFRLMERLGADKDTAVLQHPKMTLFNGQAATCQVMDYQGFVNNNRIFQHAGQVVFLPQIIPIPVGWNFSVQPVLSPDEKAIRVQLNLTFTNLARLTVPLFPITTFITPVVEGGGSRQPVPFTLFIQQPTLTTLNVNQTVNIPAGCTAILSGWKIDRETRWEGPPVLSQIPYVKDLFRLFTTGREAQYMLVLVTPQVVRPVEDSQTAEAVSEPASLPADCVGSAVPAAASGIAWGQYAPGQQAWGTWSWPTAAPTVQPVSYEAPTAITEEDFLGDVRKEMAGLLVRKYHEACQKGRFDDAKSLAEEALRLDPACFSNPGNNCCK